MLSLPATIFGKVIPWRQILLAGLAAALTATAWIAYRAGSASCDRSEIDRLLVIQDEKDQAYNRALTAMQGYYSDRLKTEAGRVKRETIVKVVPAESDCVVPADAVRLLENKRDGVSATAP